MERRRKTVPKEERQDRIELEGTVEEALPAGEFNVRVNQHTVIAKLSGRMRQHKIKIVIGDRVLVEVSPYDLSRGRLTRRL